MPNPTTSETATFVESPCCESANQEEYEAYVIGGELEDERRALQESLTEAMQQEDWETAEQISHAIIAVDRDLAYANGRLDAASSIASSC